VLLLPKELGFLCWLGRALELEERGFAGEAVLRPGHHLTVIAEDGAQHTFELRRQLGCAWSAVACQEPPGSCAGAAAAPGSIPDLTSTPGQAVVLKLGPAAQDEAIARKLRLDLGPWLQVH